MPDMIGTTTTPESRGRIAYVAFLRGQHAQHLDRLRQTPTFEELTEHERAGWIKSANTIWDLAKTGRATL
jgi:hypothetical protein